MLHLLKLHWYFEAGIEDEFDYLILINSSDENKIKECLQKENFTEEEIRKELKIKFPMKKKKKL